MLINKCDRCGKLSEARKERFGCPKDWKILKFSFITKDLCPDCCELLKISPDSPNIEAEIGDRLVEILEEIAQGVLENP